MEHKRYGGQSSGCLRIGWDLLSALVVLLGAASDAIAQADRVVYPMANYADDTITQAFGNRNRYYPCREGECQDARVDRSKRHTAHDIGGAAGTPVYAVARGRVAFASARGTCATNWGHVVVIRHELPGIGEFSSVYGHLDPDLSKLLVAKDDDVESGEQIGEIGHYNCWGDHLHFAIHVGPYGGPYSERDPYPLWLNGYMCEECYPGNYVHPKDFLDHAIAGGDAPDVCSIGDCAAGSWCHVPSGTCRVCDGQPHGAECDPCRGLRTGEYCADNGPRGYEGSPNTLITCTNGHISGEVVCPLGCEPRDQNQDDFCRRCADADGDGRAAAGCGGDDCDDSDPVTFPGNPEVCDGLDNDCDGLIDEDLQNCVLCREPGSQEVDYSCGGPCQSRFRTCQEDRHWTDWTDCQGSNDCLPGEALEHECGIDIGACRSGTERQFCTNECRWGLPGPCEGGIIPTPETCNDTDDDCDGNIDEDGVCERAFLEECEGGVGRPNYECAEDGDVCQFIRPWRNVLFCTRMCGGDADCNPDLTGSCCRLYFDTWWCAPPGICANPGCQYPDCDTDLDGWTVRQGDCDDGRPAIHPNAPEVCNNHDDNCIGGIDEGRLCPLGQSCVAGNCVQEGPCNGQPPNACGGCGPAPAEVCDFTDNDCDGQTDEGLDCFLPIYRYQWTNNRDDVDFYLSTSQNIPPGCDGGQDGVGNDCFPQGVRFYLYRYPVLNMTVPLYKLKNLITHDHLYTANQAEALNLEAQPDWEWARDLPGGVPGDTRILGYIATNQGNIPPGSTPIRRVYSQPRTAHFWAIHCEEVRIVESGQGYCYQNGAQNDTVCGVVGWVWDEPDLDNIGERLDFCGGCTNPARVCP